MGGKTMIRADRLGDELDRLAEQYQGRSDALLVVDALRWWLMEETVEDAEQDDLPVLIV